MAGWADHVGELVALLAPVWGFAASALCGGSCLAGPGHEAAGCRILGHPGTSAGSLVGRARVLKTLLPTHWQVKPDPGIRAGLPAGRALPGGTVVRNSPAMQETHLPSLAREEPLEEGMAARSSALAWQIPWTEEPGGLQTPGSQRLDAAEQLKSNSNKTGRQSRVLEAALQGSGAPGPFQIADVGLAPGTLGHGVCCVLTLVC